MNRQKDNKSELESQTARTQIESSLQTDRLNKKTIAMTIGETLRFSKTMLLETLRSGSMYKKELHEV